MNNKKYPAQRNSVLCGDIAENYLEDANPYNQDWVMRGYTGWYKGKRNSIKRHGMGNPSIGIYICEPAQFHAMQP